MPLRYPQFSLPVCVYNIVDAHRESLGFTVLYPCNFVTMSRKCCASGKSNGLGIAARAAGMAKAGVTAEVGVETAGALREGAIPSGHSSGSPHVCRVSWQ